MRIAFLFLILLAGRVRADIVDGVAAVVNDKVITYSDVRDFVQPVIAQLRRAYAGTNLVDKIKDAQLDALNSLIERHLILAEFKDKGYSFPENVVDAQMNEVIANDFAGDRAAFIKTLQAENMSLAQYRDQTRDRIIVQAMRNRKLQNEVVVSPYKVEQFYKEHPEDYRVEDKIKLRIIFIKKGPEIVPPAPTTNTVAGTGTNSTGTAATTNAAVTVSVTPRPVDVRQLMADEILGKLDAGDSFESLAKLYSEGKEAKDGGDWGWIGKDVLRKELSDVAFALKPGQHSQTIVTPDGYYLLHVEDTKIAYVRPLKEVRDEIEKILLQEQRAKTQQNWVKELRAKAYIRMF